MLRRLCLCHQHFSEAYECYEFRLIYIPHTYVSARLFKVVLRRKTKITSITNLFTYKKTKLIQKWAYSSCGSTYGLIFCKDREYLCWGKLMSHFEVAGNFSVISSVMSSVMSLVHLLQRYCPSLNI